MERNPRSKETYPDVDFTIPLDHQKFMEKATSCFGKMWNITTNECAQCADRDVCGIIYRAVPDKKAEELEEKNGTKFLDRTEFRDINPDSVEEWITSGVTTTKELIAQVMATAETDYKPAAIAWIKKFIQERDNIYTKAGIVWKR